MVSSKSVEQQLKRIRFSAHSWGRAEARELPNILMPEEQIFECVNGMYENGFALLVATNQRLLLIDKKPLKFLTVEDLRFDMINQIDYSHRMFGANISVSAGSKNLKFRSYNQERLRKLISHVQHRMTESKKEQTSQAETQQQHLEQINQQLQAYLLAQYQQQEALRKQIESKDVPASVAEITSPLKPSPELSDYLLAQNMLKQYQESHPEVAQEVKTQQSAITSAKPQSSNHEPQLADLYHEGMREVFGDPKPKDQNLPVMSAQDDVADTTQDNSQPSIAAAAHRPAFPSLAHPLEVNPLKIAYSKLPLALRNRAFARKLPMTSKEIAEADMLKRSTGRPLAAQ